MFAFMVSEFRKQTTAERVRLVAAEILIPKRNSFQYLQRAGWGMWEDARRSIPWGPK